MGRNKESTKWPQYTLTWSQDLHKVKAHMTNDSNKAVQLPAKIVIGVVSAANVVPAIIAPRKMLEEGWDQTPNKTLEAEKQKTEEWAQRGKLVVEQIDLSSIQNWSKSLQQQVNELLIEYSGYLCTEWPGAG